LLKARLANVLYLERGRRKISWTICRIPAWPFDYVVKAGQPPGPKTITGEGEIMPQYLVANYLPDDFDPSTV